MRRQRHRPLVRFWRDTQGTALIEFAVAFPVLLVLFYGAVELTRYILFTEKLESAAMQVIDIINQQNEISAADMELVFNAVPLMMHPMSNSPVSMNVTAVERARVPSGDYCNLQKLWAYPGAGTVDVAANRLPEITVQPGDTVMVMEITGRYRPILDDALQKTVIGNLTGDVALRSYSRPRYGAFRCHPVTRLCRSTPCF